jgi:chemotaxis response regulator CheB
MLLSQRGYVVQVWRRGEDVAELVAHDAVDVVLIDASASLTAAARAAARVESLYPPVAIVAVSEDLQPGLATLPVLPKWTDFDGVLAAIERARADLNRDGLTSAAR